VTVCDKPGDLPRIRTENFPVFAVLLAERVSVLVSMVQLGLNDAVAPLGKPDAVMLTLESKPFSGVTVRRKKADILGANRFGPIKTEYAKQKNGG